MVLVTPSPSQATVDGAVDLVRLATEAAIWAMPLVGFDAMRQAFFLDAGARYGDFVYLSQPADWAFQLPAPDATTRFVWLNFNLEDGPLVLAVPAGEDAVLSGALLDAWQVPVADVASTGGEDGKYLLLPPGHGEEPPPGYRPVRFDTCNGGALLRVRPAGSSREAVDQALSLVRRLSLYPLENAPAPPMSGHVDVSGRLFDAIVRFDESYFYSLARMIDEEPPLVRDASMIECLEALGIEKGKAFAPDAALRSQLVEGARAARAWLLDRSPEAGEPCWPGRRWRIPGPDGLRTGFTFETPDGTDVEGRALACYAGLASSRSSASGSIGLTSHFDAAGAPLTGDARYRLHVPAVPPAGISWALAVYDFEASAFIQRSPKVGIDSSQMLARNSDGSVDLVVGGSTPAIGGANHLPTAPGRRWFARFRCDGPADWLRDARWKLPDFELLS